MRIAIITAYYDEDRATIKRCIDSVRSQTVPVEHILVADGHPQQWIRDARVRHVVLDRPHRDFGDTPRLIGLMLAIREGFDAIQFVDADNIVFPRHAAMATQLLRDSGGHVLVLRRTMLRPDGSALPVGAPDEESLAMIDTNCYLFARPAFETALKWALIPGELSFIGDRIFRSMVSNARHPVAVATEPSVGYRCMWASIYRAAGETPPPGCRDLASDREKAAAWWSGLGNERRDEIQAVLGVQISLV